MSARMATARPLWTAADAVAATGGVAAGVWQASGVSIDSRILVPGDLFIALSGPTFDGHDYVAGALERGAAAAMVRRQPIDVPDANRLLLVPNTDEGLRALGRTARARVDARICAVTGSVGKTGTKEMLAAALAAGGSVAATTGNLNNHYGLPLSLARMPSDAAFGVFEMGMNHAGEIRPLSKLAKPHVAMITTVAPVHIEYFETIEGIAAAKAEIFEGMVEGGDAVINADQPFFRFLSEAATSAGAGRIRGFGISEDADARLVSCHVDGEGTHIEADIDGTRVAYRLQLRGRHWALNSLGVLASVAACGVDIASAARLLADVEPPKGRGRAIRVAVPGGNAIVIDETYNASPVAMRAAIELLADTEPGQGGRRIVALGDMLELGNRTEAEHMNMVQALKDAGIDLVFACGQYMGDIVDALPAEMRGGRAATSAKLAPMVGETVRAGDLVLVKGSAGARMGEVVARLAGDAVEGH